MALRCQPWRTVAPVSDCHSSLDDGIEVTLELYIIVEVRNGAQHVLGITPLIDSVSAGLIHVVSVSDLDHDLLPLGAIS